jgi:hypothetical protein
VSVAQSRLDVVFLKAALGLPAFGAGPADAVGPCAESEQWFQLSILE